MKIWKRTVSLLLAVLLCLSLAPSALAAQTAFSVAGSNMTLGNELELNIMVKKTDIKATGLTAKLTHHAQTGDVHKTVEQADWISYGSYYKFSVRVAASQMTDQVSIEITDADGTVYNQAYSTSIQDYVERNIGKFSEVTQILMVDMLNYGAAAQTHFGYRTDALANAALTEAQQAMASEDEPCTDIRVKGDHYAGSNLSLEDRILLNLIFSGISDGERPGMYAMVEFTGVLGNAVSARVSLEKYGSVYTMVPVDQIVLADSTCPVTVTVHRADGSVYGQVTDSVESYISRMNADGSNALYNNIMRFARSAWLYAAEKNGISLHNWNTGELITTPTDTEAGSALYTCLDDGCGETKLETIKAGTKVWTRADLEEAVEELSWDYLLKKDKIQYDSMELDAMGKYYSGKFLVTEGAAPEHGTSHTEINSVCSDYVWKVYEEALHHDLLGGRSSLEAVTADMWYCAENQYYTDADEDIDSVLVRWQSLAFTDLEEQFGVPDSPHFVQTKEEVFEYFLNWETMLRPGDVLVDKGHALIYAGNGKVLHCNGTKYQPTTGVLNHEDNGSVNGVSPLSCEDTSWLNTRANTGRLLVWRPTEFLVTKDTDGDLSNDMVRDSDFTMPADTLSRLAYPGMEIDRTVDITPYGTASVGQELTYSVKISNMSSNTKYLAAKQVADSTYAGVKYENLVVTETVPAGTELVSVTENGVYDEESNTITWTLDIAAGKTVTPAYTVKVTGAIGETIECGGGFVADIPSNTICNRIGGVKMNEFAEMTLADIAASDTASWNYGTDLAFAEAIYEAAETALTLPTVSEIVEDLFVRTSTLGEIRSYRYLAGKAPVDVFMLRDDADLSMVIPTYYGGYRFFTGSDAIGSTISEFRLEYLEPGDIIVNADTADGQVVGAQVMVYAGNEKLLISNADGSYQVLSGSNAKQQLWNSFLATNELFFALRPSQAADLKAAHTWDEGTLTKAPTCAAEGEMTYTCLDDGCGQTKTKVLAKTTDHGWSETASDNGNGTHLLTCTLCGQTKSQLHDWDDGVGDTTQKRFTCLDCGATKTEYAGLSEAQIELLQGFTYHKGSMTAAANSRQRPVHFADTVYAAIGLDGLVEKFNGGLTAAAVLAQPFRRLDTNGSVYGSTSRSYVLRTAENGDLTVDGVTYETALMVVDGFYGGSWLVDDDGNRLTDMADAMDIRDLQPGDVLVLGENTGSYDALLWALVYQGVLDGQHTFIFGNTYYGGSYTNVSATASYRGKLCFNAATGVLEEAVFNSAISSTGSTVSVTMEAEAGKTTFNDFLKNDLVSGIAWEYFYALRPGTVMN